MIAHNHIRIVHLCEAPQLAPTLAGWFIEEWQPWYGTGGEGDAMQDLTACQSRDTLPICLVALDADDKLLGTAALRTESVGSELGVGPWLAGFLVAPERRGRGTGAALVGAIEAEAMRLRHEAIYVSTDSARAIFERRGWQVFGASSSLRGPVSVYRCRLLDKPPHS